MCKIINRTIDNIIYTYIQFEINPDNIEILLEEKNIEKKTIKIHNNIFTKKTNFYIKPNIYEFIKCSILDTNELLIKYNNFQTKYKYIYFCHFDKEINNYLISIYNNDYKCI